MAKCHRNEVILVIFVVFLAKMLPTSAGKRCNSISDCENGTYCCLKIMVCRYNCTKVFCLSDGDCLKPKCCNVDRNKCSKKACHTNDDPYWEPLVYGTMILVGLVFLGVCFYSFCYMMPCSCPRRSARNRTVSGTSNAGHYSTDVVDIGGSEHGTQEDG